MAVYAFSMAFMNPEIIEKSLERFYSTRNTSLHIDRHLLLDQHYPLHYEKCRATLERVAATHGLELLDAGRNLGLHEGANYVLRALGLQDEDVVIAFDPDCYPITPGWDMALVRAIQGSEDIVWASLMNPRSEGDIRAKGPTLRRVVDGHIKLEILYQPVANSICAWKGSWLKKNGGLFEPRPYYGHLECAMWAKMDHEREKWAFLPGYTESDHLRDGHDREYQVWKWRHAHLMDWDGDFASFVEAGCPETGPAPKKLP